MTSEALGGQFQSCYTARARPKSLTEEIFCAYGISVMKLLFFVSYAIYWTVSFSMTLSDP